MRPCLLAAMALVALSSHPLTAFAQDTDCPSGAWFCATDEAVQIEVDGTPPALPPPETARPVVVVQPESTASSPPPVVIIVLPGRSVIQRPRPAVSPTRHRRILVRKATPRKTITPVTSPVKLPVTSPVTSKGGWKRIAGFDVHAQRMSFLGAQGNSAISPDAKLIGGGAGLRIPTRRRSVEVQAGNEFLYGTDFNGFDRGELGISTHLVRHFNPESRLRFYALFGGMLALGSVQSTKPNALLPKESDNGVFFATYGGLSGQAGVGAELRLTSYLSVHVDALASFRWRFAATNDAPEYINPQTGIATNTYPGLLLRSGITFW